MFRWATVTAVSPLRVRLDGDTAALPFEPDSLVDPRHLAGGDRVRCELADRRVVLTGRSQGIALPSKNLATNPSFETGDGSSTAVRENLATVSAATALGTVTITAGVSYDGKTWTRVTTGASANHGVRMNCNEADLVDGAPYTATWEVANDGASAVAVAVDMADGGGNVTTVEPGETVRVTATHSRIYDSVYRFSDLYLPTAGTSILFREVIVERGRVSMPYFDGSTADGEGFTYAWSGTVGASKSVHAAPGPAGYSHPSTMKGVQSLEWASAGSKSLRQIPDSGTTSTTYTSRDMPTAAGKQYTVLVKCRLAAAQTGTIDFRARRVMVRSSGVSDVYSEAALNEPGETVLRVSFTASASTATVFLFNGASLDGGDVWWDDVLIVEGDYSGGYFDGDSPHAIWVGTPHASQSFGIGTN